MISRAGQKKQAVVGAGLAWVLFVGNVLFLLALLVVMPVYRRMESGGDDVLDSLRLTLFLIDAVAVLSVFFGRPLIATIVVGLTSTVSVAISEWFLDPEVAAPGYYMVLAFFFAYWDFFALVIVCLTQNKLQRLVETHKSSGSELRQK